MPQTKRATAPRKSRRPRPVKGPEVHEATLRNGLRVRIVPNPDLPTLSLYTLFQVGSRNEGPGITGISHLFEHMMFNGSERYGPGEFDKTLESHGGHSNAYTSHDVTVYHEDFPPEALEKVLDLESDRMRALRIDDKSLARERQVVKEERRMAVENDTFGLLHEELESLVFKASPYRWPIIGWMEDIERITRKQCEDYFRTYYAPNNALLYLAGAVEPRRALALIRGAYSDIPKGPPPPPVADDEPEQRGERRAEIVYPAQAPLLMVAYQAPRATDPDSFTLDVLQFVLSVGASSRLNRGLVYGRRCAVSAGCDWAWRKGPGMFSFTLELPVGGDPAVAEQGLQEELERIISEGISDLELQKAQNNLLAHLWREGSTNGGRAESLATYEALLGSWQEANAMAARYRAIDADQVREAARRYLDPRRRSVATLKPGVVS